jgi:UrcA family protein
LNDLTSTQETTVKALTTATYLPNLIQTAIFGTLALMGGAPSMANDRDEVRQVVVRYGDLNVSNPQGAAELYSRIATAAREVCGGFDFDDHRLEARARTEACVRKAISGAVIDVRRPELFAIYNAKHAEALGMPVAATHTR